MPSTVNRSSRPHVVQLVKITAIVVISLTAISTAPARDVHSMDVPDDARYDLTQPVRLQETLAAGQLTGPTTTENDRAENLGAVNNGAANNGAANNGAANNETQITVPVPEPATVALVLLGLVGLGLIGLRYRWG